MMRAAKTQAAAMWAGRTAREQVLLAAGAAVSLALVAWFAVIDPVMGWRDAAGARHAVAVAQYEAVAQGVARSGRWSPVPPRARDWCCRGCCPTSQAGSMCG